MQPEVLWSFQQPVTNLACPSCTSHHTYLFIFKFNLPYILPFFLEKGNPRWFPLIGSKLTCISPVFPRIRSAWVDVSLVCTVCRSANGGPQIQSCPLPFWLHKMAQRIRVEQREMSKGEKDPLFGREKSREGRQRILPANPFLEATSLRQQMDQSFCLGMLQL